MIQSDFPSRQPAPKIGSNGNWWEWDELTQAYVDTGRPSRGDSAGLSDDIKTALLTLAQKAAYVDEHGQDYYDALYAALYPSAELLSITASFAQGSHVVYDTDTLESLKPYLTVTAHYDDNTDTVVSDYTLSGALTEGTSTITVSFGGKTTTFSVTVAHGTSPVITDTGVYFDESGTLLQSNNWCVSDYYEFPYKGSLPFTFVINAGADNNPGATAYLITYDSTNAKTNSYLTSIIGEKELGWRTVAPYAKFRASLCTKNGAPYYAYIKETGEVVFAGIDSPYYGMSNISEANQS